MRLTAHKVITAQGDRGGINAFRMDEEGNLTAERIDVVPGGNRVMSYLEILAPAAASLDQVLEFARAVRPEALRSDEQEFSDQHTGASLAFAWLNSDPVEVERTFEDLVTACEEVARAEEKDLPWSVSEPLVILVQIHENSLEFKLSEESQQRLTKLPLDLDVFPAVSVGRDTFSDFEAITGMRLTPHLLPALSGLTEEQVLRAGGAVFVDAASGDELGHWPPK